MDPVLWYVLPLAVAVALSIFPVLAAVLLLLARDPVRAGLGYAAGWALGIVALVAAFAGCARLIPDGISESLPSWIHYVGIIAGALLVVEGTVAAVRDLRGSRPTTPPGWLQRASGLSARRAFVFGVLMNVRPKNLALTLAAGLAIGGAPITLVGGGISVLVFTLVGASTVAGLVLSYMLSPQKIRPVLGVLNTWLVSNASVVLRFSLVVIGVVLMSMGINALDVM